MLKLRARWEHCTVVDLLMVFVTIVNETSVETARTNLEYCMTVHLLIVDSLVRVVSCFKSVLQVYIYLFFSCLNFVFEMLMH